MPIIVGTGTIDPNIVVRDTQQAKDLGADASLIITPYYVKPPQRALVKHFTDIADAVDLPMILYVLSYSCAFSGVLCGFYGWANAQA